MKNIWFVISFVSFSLLSPLTSAQAAQYDLKEMTPEVQQAISSRQNNYSQLQSLKTNGEVGETNRGYVAALTNSPTVQMLVDSENRDRKVIYETIASQNNLGASGFSIIETVFGEVQREKAHAGESVQNASGEWVQK